MEANTETNYKKVFIAFQLSERANRLLSESAKRSNRRKLQEAAMRLEDHLNQVFAISHVDMSACLVSTDTGAL